MTGREFQPITVWDAQDQPAQEPHGPLRGKVLVILTCLAMIALTVIVAVGISRANDKDRKVAVCSEALVSANEVMIGYLETMSSKEDALNQFLLALRASVNEDWATAADLTRSGEKRNDAANASFVKVQGPYDKYEVQYAECAP